MRRREFITLLGGAAAWPLAARAQQPAMPVVGLSAAGQPRLPGALALRSVKPSTKPGYVEGHNVMVEYHWLDGQYDRLPALMADLVRSRVAVIATPGSSPAALAAKAATTTVPIVFGVAEDPVKLGLVASLARPGGNATGINLLSAEVVAKRMGLLRDLVPRAVRVAVLRQSSQPFDRRGYVTRHTGSCACPRTASSGPPRRHQPRDRGSLCDHRARPGRCSFRRPRRVLHQPARPICDARGAPCHSRGLFQP